MLYAEEWKSLEKCTLSTRVDRLDGVIRRLSCKLEVWVFVCAAADGDHLLCGRRAGGVGQWGGRKQCSRRRCGRESE